MMLHIFVLSLPAAALGQFAPMGLEPDVAFGDHNDRFDLSGVLGDYRHHKHGDPRRGNPLLEALFRRSNLDLPKSRRDDEWLDDMNNLAEDRIDTDGLGMAEDYSRRSHRVFEGMTAANADKLGKPPLPATEREILLHYALPIKIKVQDRPNGSFITGAHILSQ